MALPKRTVHKMSRTQERWAASRTGGRRQPGSGAPFNKKGDVDANDYLMECKVTRAKRIIIKKDVLDKIRKEANRRDKKPVVVFSLEEGGPDDAWAMIRFNDFAELTRRRRKRRGT